MKRGNLIALVFSEVPPDTHYRKGFWSWVDEKKAKEYMSKGYAEEWKPEEDRLPDDLPGKKAFLEAGYNDLDVIKNLADWDEVPGIGQITEDKLVEYFGSE